MNVFELYGSLGLKTEEFTKKLNEAGNNFKDFSGGITSKVGAIVNVIKGVAGTVATVDNAITTVFDTAVSTVIGGIGEMSSAAAGFAESFMTTGLTFDSSISQVSATLLKSKEDFETTQVTIDGFSGSLRDLAKELGATTKFTATQAGEALNYMALAGYDAQTSAEMLPKVLNLAAAGAMDLGTASDMVTDAQTALGLSLDDTTLLIDQMAKTASSSNTSVSQLGDAILSIGATGRQLKGGYTELNTALGVLADNGIKASEGGNDLRRILIRLTAPGTEAAKTMESLGFSAYDAQGNIKSLPDMFLELNKAMEGYTEQQRNVAINDIFGQYALAGANALLNTSSERWEELTNKIVDSKGAAKEMADIQLDNLQGKMTILKSAIEGLQISFSDLFSGRAQEYVERLSNGLGDITKQIDEGDFKGGFYALGNTIVDLINQGADDILNSEDEATNFADGFILLLKKVVSTLIDRGEEVLPAITDFFTETATKAIDALAEIVNNPEQFGKIIGTINLILTKLQTFLDENEDELYEIFDKVFDASISIIEKIFVLKRKTISNILLRKGKEILEEFGEDWKSEFKRLIIDRAAEGWLEFGENLKQLPRKWEENFQPLGDAIWNSIDLTGKRIKKWWEKRKEEITSIRDGFLNGWSQFANEWTNTVTDTIDKIKNAIGEVKLAITDIVDKAKTWGSDLINNFMDGITAMKDALGRKVSEVAETISSFLHFSLPEKGPLATSNEWMPDFMQNLADGIEKNRSLVKNAANNVASDLAISPKVGDMPTPQNYGGQTFNFEFKIGNITGVTRQNTEDMARTISDMVAAEIYRTKMAVI